MTPDWSFLGYELARFGISSDTEEIVTEAYPVDPWRPEPDTDGVRVTLDRAGAIRLVDLLDALFEMSGG